ncbi:pantoate--beta-alanine ligase [Methylocella tundrae]|uniref:Pantothenate synthetase n=1 Tax=Methylocella tundrae TaxID=227605 RepID=A0A4U8YUT4_METTU|nr:pantoate--beta-alanine ligase [Methylocella tundrae]WPP04772.1 pantoate--beta-alanine ligase [Methylocella tundrae]VFU06985.1 Pantothenate synthetase 2 [Methylocella tundrae]
MGAEDQGRVKILREVAALRQTVANWRAAGESIALTPTMGALHKGHVSLVALARKRASRVVMSIFVNPTQFAPNEDFGAYPRTFGADVALFAAAGGDAVFAPDVAEMYGAGFSTLLNVAGPAAAGLEDQFRPTHFAGVATVVTKLVNQCRPDIAIFGEKDYQQLKVIERVARDLDLGAEIIGAPTIREADGLALSSRNVYLSPEERKAAPALHAALQRCAAGIRGGGAVDVALAQARASVEAAGFIIDYIEAREAETLAPLAAPIGAPVRLLAAARLGKTRLIDNIGV